jgi:hypothetical protein
MRKQTRSGGRSTALRPPSTELLGIAPLNGTAKNGVTKRHQTFHAVPDDFLSAKPSVSRRFAQRRGQLRTINAAAATIGNIFMVQASLLREKRLDRQSNAPRACT